MWLYNTKTRRKEEFVPLQAGKVKVYTCGPTVYDLPHIGNLRTFLWSDLLARVLQRKGLEVYNVMNITDVDDKTIIGAKREGKSLAEYTKKYIDGFFEELEALRVKPAWKYPRATDHIGEMLEMIQTLIDRGHAYEQDGSVYFDISSISHYGALSGVVPDEHATHFGRLDSDQYEREDVRDFVLWKAAREGEPSWDSPWGPGRPGWHIECSAMALKYLGETVDIHMGGVDLVFPHHENETAQSEAATGQEFVRYWLHVEHLVVEGQKMSKSLGNFYTLRDLLQYGYEPVVVRHQLMTAHYRQQLNFTLEGLEQSHQALTRLWNFVDRVKEVPVDAQGVGLMDEVQAARSKFDAELDDDLNVPGALGAVYELIRRVNPLLARAQVSAEGARRVLDFLADADTVLGIVEHESGALDLNEEEVEALLAERERARARKDWERADRIREELRARGVVVEDTPTGSRWRLA